MQWTQYKPVDGVRAKFSRYKCNLCGITQMIAAEPGSNRLPEGWSSGDREGWHTCPGCQRQPRKRTLLPVVHA